MNCLSRVVYREAGRLKNKAARDLDRMTTNVSFSISKVFPLIFYAEGDIKRSIKIYIKMI